MTDEPTTEAPAAPRKPAARHPNPGPRPALRRSADQVSVEAARPGVGAPAAPLLLGSGPLAPPDDSPSGRTRRKKHDKGRSKSSRSKDSGPKRDAAKGPERGKDPGKRKDDKHHRKHDPQPSDDKQQGVEDDRSLTITFPKHVRKALAESAVEHGTTPERLVALVLGEWLDQ